MAPEVENELLENVDLTRRSFVRKAVLGSAFAIPVVASFDMRSVQADASECLTPNQNFVQTDGTYGFKVLSSSRKNGVVTIKVKVSNPDTHENLSRNGREVRLTKIYGLPDDAKVKLPKKFEFANGKTNGRHYELRLNVKDWPKAFYELKCKVADDSNGFYIGLYTGNCS